jgi:two-component system phosphate regulon sensor histidine kinase PhoR
MKNKIAIYISVICIIAVLLVFGLGILVTKSNNYEQAEDKAVDLANTLSALYDGDYGIVDCVGGTYRVTVIDSTGKVLADTDYADVSGMENHLDREEIIAALNGKPKTVKRKSDTSGDDMLYYAVKKETGENYVFIRAAVHVESINAYIVKTVPIMLGISAFAILCAVFCSIFIASRLVRPLTEVKNGLSGIRDGEYKKVAAISSDKEISEIIGDINSLGETLDKTIYELKAERENLNQIVNTINDGIILLCGEDIALINDGAKNLFNCTDKVIGKNAAALTDNGKIIDALSNASEWNSFECEENNRNFICSVKTLENGMVLVVFSDVTAERNSQKIRSDFFSNAGHELKTPLTAITGFNDIIKQNDKSKSFEKYTARISVNADRMLNLVNDMLKLSELENESPDIAEEIKVADVAKQVKNDLQMLADGKKITIEINGTATVKATEPHIYELLKNLVENGIKYGKDNGFVKIKLGESNKKSFIEVSDDGIGIDEKHQSRIFERFYRVEKSRSRATGGTGLGLAIVKHIALLYGGEISIKSKLGFGTTVSVAFSK